MADKKISQLDVGTAAAGDSVPIARSGANYKVTAGDIAALKQAAGADTQIQFNDGGTAFAGDSTLTFNKTSKTLGANSISLSGNISAAAWTTNGVRYKNAAATLTDTSSSGTVAAAYTNVFGGNTIAASNSTTFTDYATMYIAGPTNGTNVTFTNKWSAIFNDQIKAPTLQLGTAGSTIGTLKVSGNTSGTVTVSPAAAAGTWTLTLPNSGGTNGQFLQTNGSGTTSWVSVGTKTLQRFTPLDNQPPASSFATLDTRNSIALLDFDDAAVESAVFVGVVPENANLASGIMVRINWMATSATSGNVRWRVEFENMTTDLDSDSFDTAVEGNGVANGTSGIPTVTEITATTIDSLAAGSFFRLRVSRVGNDATNDTMTGDAELIAVEVRGVA